MAIDYEGRVDGAVFPGGKGEGLSVTIGAHRVLPEIEQALVGMSVGDAKTHCGSVSGRLRRRRGCRQGRRV